MIGMDTEWRPILRHFSDREERMATLQLSSETNAFVIDMIAFSKNKLLDEILTSIFTDTGTLCMGFSFTSDFSMLKKSFKGMSFY